VTLAAVRENLEKSAAFKLEYRIKQLPAGQKIVALEKSQV
jgi:putative endonuclease